jgi:solute carrier family 25 citrate transporter 1
MSPSPDFVSPSIVIIAGGFAGAVETACTYSFEFAKTEIQLRSEVAPRSKPRFLVVRGTVRTDGARALYKGCTSLVVGSIAKDGAHFLSFGAMKRTHTDPAACALTLMQNLVRRRSSIIHHGSY